MLDARRQIDAVGAATGVHGRSLASRRAPAEAVTLHAEPGLLGAGLGTGSAVLGRGREIDALTAATLLASVAGRAALGLGTFALPAHEIRSTGVAASTAARRVCSQVHTVVFGTTGETFVTGRRAGRGFADALDAELVTRASLTTAAAVSSVARQIDTAALFAAEPPFGARSCTIAGAVPGQTGVSGGSAGGSAITTVLGVRSGVDAAPTAAGQWGFALRVAPDLGFGVEVAIPIGGVGVPVGVTICARAAVVFQDLGAADQQETKDKEHDPFHVDTIMIDSWCRKVKLTQEAPGLSLRATLSTMLGHVGL